MPFEIFPEPSGMYVRYHGHVTPEEMVRSVADGLIDPSFDCCQYRINDFLGVQSFEFSEEAFEYVAAISSGGAFTRQRDGVNGLVAQVAVQSSHLDLIVRYSALGIVPYRFGTFATVDSARQWVASEIARR